MKKTIYFCFLPLLLAIGCAWGARTKITATQAAYPVSMSRGVRDQNGEIVGNDRRQTVGKFEYKTKTWSTFYTLAPITPRRNISKAVNAQVKQANGEAIINLTTVVQSCRVPNYIFIFNLLPIWPSCAKIEVFGDIIKVAPAQPTSAPVPSAGVTEPSNTLP
jgi:hypothetical protein